MRELKEEKGITLIALVITIIVLLILAGVSIATLTSNNGILEKVGEAKTETQKAKEKEIIKLAIAEMQISPNEYEEITTEDLNDVLVKVGEKIIVVDEEDGTKKIKFLNSKNIYKLNNGNIEDIDSNIGNEYMVPPSQDEERNKGVIGIGTDGKPVDMDLWEYTLMKDGTFGLNDSDALIGSAFNRSAGYLGEYTNEGKIIGKIPQYISTDNGQNYIEVTSLVHTFYNCDNLKIAPEIPQTIKNMDVAFYLSKNLQKAPDKIPNSVILLNYTFSDCKSLNTIPILGKNIEQMNSTFRNTAIENFNIKLPERVKNVFNLFTGSKLKYFNADIPSELTSIEGMFLNCENLIEFTGKIPSSITSMQQTFNKCYNLEKINTVVPSSVKNLFQTFAFCTKLEGKITINANLKGAYVYEWAGNKYKDYEQSFNESCTEGKGLTINGECQLLEELRNGNPKISIGKCTE